VNWACEVIQMHYYNYASLRGIHLHGFTETEVGGSGWGRCWRGRSTGRQTMPVENKLRYPGSRTSRCQVIGILVEKAGCRCCVNCDTARHRQAGSLTVWLRHPVVERCTVRCCIGPASPQTALRRHCGSWCKCFRVCWTSRNVAYTYITKQRMWYHALCSYCQPTVPIAANSEQSAPELSRFNHCEYTGWPKKWQFFGTP